MKVLVVLTYYRPHVSGLTIYVERLARQLVERGHEVTVLTSRHDPSLPREEVLDGVRVVRVPVWARVSKGVLTPIAWYAAREARRADAVSIHLPQFDGGMVALVSRLLRNRTVLTYHCDLRLPRGLVNRVADAVTFVMNVLAGCFAHTIVAYTQEYADHSPLLRIFRRKVEVVLPPVVMAVPDAATVDERRRAWGADAGPVIGAAARLATEKGVEFLVDAMPIVVARFPDARVVFAGPHEDVVGEGHYRAQLQPGIDALGERWQWAGVLEPAEMAVFFAAVDVLVVSSINSTESFGLVQVEAMLCGTPVVATDLPGVRQPVTMTGMGRIVPPRDAAALAEAIVDVHRHRRRYLRPHDEIADRFDVARTVDAYERLLATATTASERDQPTVGAATAPDSAGS